MTPLTFAATLFLGLLIGYGIGAFRHPVCWWDVVSWRIRTGLRVDGHVYADRERLNNCIVTTSQCERCETWHVGWERTELSAPEPHRAHGTLEAS